MMSNKPLDFLNKHRTRGKPNAKLDEIVYKPGTYPMEDLAIPEESDIVDAWREFQFNPDTNSKPKWRKRNLPDYKPGKVKVYTDEEIAQYMEERDGQAKV